MIGHWWNGAGPAQPSPKRHARLRREHHVWHMTSPWRRKTNAARGDAVY
jgi:hypothetical protein